MIAWLSKLIWADPVGGEKPKARRSKLWPAVRGLWLKEHPKCAVCGQTENCVPHHIKPFHLFPEFELHGSNLVTLCEGKKNDGGCHLLFGHLRLWASYNPSVVDDVMIWRWKLTHRPEQSLPK